MSLFSINNKKRYKESSPSTVRGAISYSGGTVVSPVTAMKVSAFYRGVTYISTQIAKLPWHVKDKTNNIQRNKIAKLLSLSPNKEMNALQFKLFIIQSALIYGNGYAEIERNNIGEPVALWPIINSDVELVRDPNGKLWYRIIGGSTLVSGQDSYLDINDMFHVKNFYTHDGLLGQGIVAYGSEVLGIALGADRLANNLYANGGLPSGVLTAPGSLSDEAFKRLKESWQENHSGRKTGGTAILEEGTSYLPISFSPDVLQFLESRKFSVLEIARFLGLPPTKLFDGESATYNNIEHSNLEVAVDTLDAWARNLEMEADIKLIGSNGFASGNKTEMDLYAVFRGDMATRSQYFTRMMQSAAITPNEIREKEGLNPYEGGDRYFVATNNFTPADRIDEMLDANIKSKSENKKEESDSDKEINKAVVDFLKTKS